LALELTALSQASVLEAMRARAGLSYGQLANLAGIPRARAVRFCRGVYSKPVGTVMARLRDVCWDRLPRQSPGGEADQVPAFLKLEEAAALLSESPLTVRGLILRRKELRAVRVGKYMRIPRAGIEAYLRKRVRKPGGQRRGGLNRQELAAILRVDEHAIRYAEQRGCLGTIKGRKRYSRVLIPMSEVNRVLRHGTDPLALRGRGLPRSRRAKR
jgi:excisionase family DNA binding protein